MTTRTETALSFADVSKIYETFGSGQRYALHGVSFEAPMGRRIAIVGRSGSGKSTLLHLAAGIDVPTQGAVTILGQSLESLSETARTLLRRDGVGLIFQFFYLLPHLSICDNVALPALIAGERPADFEPRVTQLLDRVGLGGRAHDPVQKLSGGEMQQGEPEWTRSALPAVWPSSPALGAVSAAAMHWTSRGAAARWS
jgi:ABC-type lipoprotein export system ATPase subunit